MAVGANLGPIHTNAHDVLYMNLDLLDESYPMVKSILHFEQVDQTGLTGSTGRANFGHQHNLRPWLLH